LIGEPLAALVQAFLPVLEQTLKQEGVLPKGCSRFKTTILT